MKNGTCLALSFLIAASTVANAAFADPASVNTRQEIIDLQMRAKSRKAQGERELFESAVSALISMGFLARSDWLQKYARSFENPMAGRLTARVALGGTSVATVLAIKGVLDENRSAELEKKVSDAMLTQVKNIGLPAAQSGALGSGAAMQASKIH